MEKERFYFRVYKEKDIVLGLNIGLYPNIYLWVRLPFFEIRMGI